MSDFRPKNYPDREEYVSLPRAAQYCHCSVAELYLLAEENYLRLRRQGEDWVVLKEDLESYLESKDWAGHKVEVIADGKLVEKGEIPDVLSRVVDAKPKTVGEFSKPRLRFTRAFFALPVLGLLIALGIFLALPPSVFAQNGFWSRLVNNLKVTTQKVAQVPRVVAQVPRVVAEVPKVIKESYQEFPLVRILTQREVRQVNTQKVAQGVKGNQDIRPKPQPKIEEPTSRLPLEESDTPIVLYEAQEGEGIGSNFEGEGINSLITRGVLGESTETQSSAAFLDLADVTANGASTAQELQLLGQVYFGEGIEVNQEAAFAGGVTASQLIVSGEAKIGDILRVGTKEFYVNALLGNDHRVGINTAHPQHALDVNGTAKVIHNLYLIDDAKLYQDLRVIGKTDLTGVLQADGGVFIRDKFLVKPATGDLETEGTIRVFDEAHLYSNTYVKGYLLLQGSNQYINFNTTLGTTGYGFRDNAGTMQYKNASGAWLNFGSDTSSSFWTQSGTAIYYNAGNVGIGATTPLALLDLRGRLYSTSTFAFGGATTQAYNVIGDAVSGMSHGLASDDDLYIEGDLEVDGSAWFDGSMTVAGTFYVNTVDTTFTAGSAIFAGTNGALAQDNSNFFWDETNHRLGIGTTTPEGPLSVRGYPLFYRNDGVASGEHLLGWFRKGNNFASNEQGLYLGYRADGANVTGVFLRQAGNGGELSLGTYSANQAILITNYGKVGIGNTQPDRQLDILDANNPQLRLTRSDSTSYTEFQTSAAGDLTINPSGGNVFLADADTLIIGGALEKAYNVIGDTTTNMGHSLASDDDLYIEGDLEVDGSAWFDGSVTVVGNFAGTNILLNGSNRYLNFATTIGTGGYGFRDSGGVIQYKNSGGSWASFASLEGQSLWTDAGSYIHPDTATSVAITDTNYVGIGTTNPGVALDVHNGWIQASNQYGLSLKDTGGTGRIALKVDASNNLQLGDNNTFGNIFFLPGATEQMRLTSAGRLGIGTTQPGYDLHVLTYGTDNYVAKFEFASSGGGGESAAIALRDDNAGVDQKVKYFMSSGGYIYIGKDVDDEDTRTHQLTIDNNGNVGIGTTQPDRKLDVLDSTNPQLRLTKADGAAYVDFRADASGDLTITPSGGNILGADTTTFSIGGAPTRAYNVIGDHTNTMGHSLASDDDLYIEGDLEVDGSAWFDASVTIAGNFAATNILLNGSNKYLNFATTIGTGGYGFRDSGGVMQYKNSGGSWANITDLGGESLWTDAGSYIHPDTATRVAIRDTSWVGIGTTNPGAELHVSGTEADVVIRITGATTSYTGLQIGATNGYFVGVNPSDKFIINRDMPLGSGTGPLVIIDTVGKVGIGTATPINRLDVEGAAVIGRYFSGSHTAPAEGLLVQGNVGVGTSSPGRKLDILDTTNPQLRLTKADGTAYTDFQTSSAGDLTINPSGGNVFLSDGDTLIIGGALEKAYNVIGDTTTNMGHSLASDDDLYIEGDLEVDGSAWFDGSMTVAGTLYVSTVDTTFTAGSVIFAGANGILAQDNSNLFWNDSSNYLGIGTTQPDRKLDILDASNPQMRLTYLDGVRYVDLEADASGNLIVQPAGNYLWVQKNGGNPMVIAGDDASNYVSLTYVSSGDYGRIQSYANNAADKFILNPSGGNVGIGTTQPDRKLDILDASNPQLRLTRSDGASYTEFQTSSAGDLTINPSGGNVFLSDGDTLIIGGALEKAYNVIGDTTTNMGHSLASDDDLYIEGDLEVDGSAWFDGSMTVAGTLYVSTVDTTFTAGSVIFAGANGILAQDNSNLFWNDSSNYLGIGTTQPDRKIDILDATDPQLRLTKADGTAYTDFRTNSSGDLTITPSGGNISGADTTTFSFGGAPTRAYNVIGDHTNTMGHSLASDDDLYIEGDLEVDGSAWFDASVTVANKFTVDSNTLHVNSDTDRVGIGTTGPGARLELAAAPTGVDGLRIGTNNSSEIKFTGSTIANIYQSVSNQVLSISTNGGELWLGSSASASHLVIDSGNVGIATTQPDRKLDILDASNPQLRLTKADGVAYTDFQTSSNGYLYIQPSGGRVGIFTTTPGEAMEMACEGDCDFRMLSANESNPPNLQFYNSAGTLSSPAVMTIGQEIGALTANTYDGATWRLGGGVRFYIDGDVSSGDVPTRIEFTTAQDGSYDGSMRMVIKNSGKVGINDSFPDEYLVVNGAVRSAQAYKDAFAWSTNSALRANLAMGINGGYGGQASATGRAFDTTAGWSTYDPGAVGVGTDPDGYQGAVFDGRYVYFVPFNNGDTYAGEVLRYDTTKTFNTTAAWSAFDPGSNGVGSDPDGYQGATFDGRFIYFSPIHNGQGYHGEVLRYDTIKPFDSTAGWATYDPGANGVGTDPDGYITGTFDGRYVYFSPYNNGTTFSGEVLRYDTSKAFNSATSWKTYDPGANGLGSDPEGFAGSIFDGRYVYFVPLFNGAANSPEIMRYDTTGQFDSTSGWAIYNATSEGSEIGGYDGAVFDGRYIYFVASSANSGVASAGEFLRYDTAGLFSASASWSTFDPQENGVGTNPRGFRGGIFDGRYAYFVPAQNTGSTGWNGEVLRYDSTMKFDNTQAWKTFDAGANGIGTDPDGYCGGTFDGRYLYFAPNHNGTSYHGEVLRFDTGAPAPQQGITQVARSQDLFLNSSNFIGIGTTNPGYKLHVSTDSASSYAANFFNDGNNANRYGIRIQGGADDGSGTTPYITAVDGNGDIVGYIQNGSGTFQLVDVSDLRTKTNVVDTQIQGLNVINGLRVVDFNRLQDPDGPTLHGFIAQEALEVFPDMITEGPDGMLGISYTNLVPVLTKAIQEQESHLSVLDQGMLLLSNHVQGLLSDSAPDLLVLDATLKADQTPWDQRLALLESALNTSQDQYQDLESRLASFEQALAGWDTNTVVSSQNTQEVTQTQSASLEDTLHTLIDSLDSLDSVSGQLSTISNSILTVMQSNQANTARIQELEQETDQIKQILHFVDEKVVIGGTNQYLVLDGATGLEIKSENFTLDPQGNLTLKGTLNLLSGKINAENGLLELNPGEDQEGRGRVVVRGDLEVTGNLVYGASAQRSADPLKGRGTIQAGETYIQIDNQNVIADSLIYITPTSYTFDQVLYISEIRKSDYYDPDDEENYKQGFTVAINKAAEGDIAFNWWIAQSEETEGDQEDDTAPAEAPGVETGENMVPTTETESSVQAVAAASLPPAMVADSNEPPNLNPSAPGEAADTTPQNTMLEPPASEAASLPRLRILPTETGYLNVRSAPSATALAEIIGQVYPGEEYEYTSLVEGWYEIVWKIDGSKGWVSGEYVQALQ